METYLSYAGEILLPNKEIGNYYITKNGIVYVIEAAKYLRKGPRESNLKLSVIRSQALKSYPYKNPEEKSEQIFKKVDPEEKSKKNSDD